MPLGRAAQIIRGVLWRLAWPTHILLLWARKANDLAEPNAPEGLRLVRVAGRTGGEQQLVVEAMRNADEPDGLVAPRLAHGDEFFGWAAGARIVSFGWVTTRDRAVGPFPLTEAPGRVFLYNFSTLPEYRGRGLYPALLVAIRSVLSKETATEFVIDVDRENAASRRGIEKAGFVLMGRVSFLTLFRRWRYPLRRTRLVSQGDCASPCL